MRESTQGCEIRRRVKEACGLLDFLRMKVRDVMTVDVQTVDRNDELRLAEDVMTMKRIRHLPVLDNGRLVGILSQRDLFHAALSTAMGFGEKAQKEFLGAVPVKEAMNDELVTIGPDEDVRKAAREMLDRQIGCLPVVEDGKLLGLVTESDLLRIVAEK
jgi:CBS domain-containing protein